MELKREKNSWKSFDCIHTILKRGTFPFVTITISLFFEEIHRKFCYEINNLWQNFANNSSKYTLHFGKSRNSLRGYLNSASDSVYRFKGVTFSQFAPSPAIFYHPNIGKYLPCLFNFFSPLSTPLSLSLITAHSPKFLHLNAPHPPLVSPSLL